MEAQRQSSTTSDLRTDGTHSAEAGLLTDRTPSGRASSGRLVWMLGPAFVAAIAYVDPGNVAANLTAGAKYGYLLVWVLVAANVMAILVQYLAAKLGLVTGQSQSQLMGARLRRPSRLAYWVQAEVVAAATDLAEIIGGALALHILFGTPLLVGGIIVGLASLALLLVQSRGGQRPFELVVVTLLVVITIGFMAGLFFSPLSLEGMLHGLVPRFEGTETVLLAASMLGATVMPHAIYLHSGLARDRHGASLAAERAAELADGCGLEEADPAPTASSIAASGTSTRDAGDDRDASATSRLGRLLRATKVDVMAALLIAGSVNIGLLLLAAASLPGVPGTDTIEGAHAAITANLGPAVGVVFGVGLLVSGLASTSVGAYAGADIMRGLLHVRIPLFVRRIVTLVPALVVLGIGVDPTRALVYSQVVLSIGIPFALIPLVAYTSRSSVMGRWRNPLPLSVAAWLVTGLIVALNVALVVLVATGSEVG